MSPVLFGIASLVVQGFVETVRVVSARIMKEKEMPYFRINAVSCLISLFFLGAFVFCLRVPVPTRKEVKWVVLRGIFGATTFLFTALAVRVGVSPGDVGAFCSINAIVAPLLGRAFLGEPLRRVHVVAVVCSIVGAMLISKPQFFFGGSRISLAELVGYVLSIAAGITLACISISVRKVPFVSIWWLTISSVAMTFLCFAILPFTPVIDERLSLGPLQDSPWQVVVLVLFFFVCIVVAIGCASAGNMWCPAAVSSTTGTTARMVWGYFAQLVLFGVSLDPVTLSGAILMLFGVVAVACSRSPPRGVEAKLMEMSEASAIPRSANASVPIDVDPTKADAPAGAEVAVDRDENESLASFIASEFAERRSDELRADVRRRSTIPAAGQGDAQRIGADLEGIAT